jgi:hypothetical protein
MHPEVLQLVLTAAQDLVFVFFTMGHSWTLGRHVMREDQLSSSEHGYLGYVVSELLLANLNEFAVGKFGEVVRQLEHDLAGERETATKLRAQIKRLAQIAEARDANVNRRNKALFGET